MKTKTRSASLLAGIGLVSALMATQAFATLVTVKVKNSVGGPLAGATISAAKSPSHTFWDKGTTDANGDLSVDLANGNWAFRAEVNKTYSPITPYQDISADADAEFQTAAISAEVKTCAGVAVSDASIEYQVLPSPIRRPMGKTDALGKVSMEMFPGTFGFSAVNLYTRTADMVQDVVANPLVNFTTTKVTLNFSGTIKYFYHDPKRPTGSWYSFSKPSMEMFGGPIQFKFVSTGGDQLVTLNVAGCEFSRAMLQLVDAAGNGLAGGKAQPASGGGWLPTLPGQTDVAGLLFCDLDPGAYTKIKMTMNQSSQEKSKARLVTDNYAWQTGTATINVKNAAGAGMPGVVIDQGGGVWVSGIATTDASGVAKVPMFAGSGKFRANYNFTTQDFTQGVPSTFLFQTGQVQSGSGTCTHYSTGAWRTFTQDMELFPGSYNFKFSDGTPVTNYPITAGVVNPIH